jgi:hypothetical protein
MMNKSLRARARESSNKRCYGFQTVRRFGDSAEDAPNQTHKKRAAVSGGF